MGSIFSSETTKNVVSSSQEPDSDIIAGAPLTTSPQSYKSSDKEGENDATDGEFINHGQLHFEQIRAQWLQPKTAKKNENDQKTETQNKQENNEENENDKTDENENKMENNGLMTDTMSWYDVDDEELPKVYKHFFESTDFEQPIPLESMIEVMRKLWMQEEQAGYEYTQASQANTALSLERLQ